MRRFVPLALTAAIFALSGTMLPPAQASAGPCRPGQGANLRGKDFTRGASLPYSLRCADLTKAKLNGVDLSGKDMTGAVLRGAHLKQANLTQATLKYADLRGADLAEADLGQMHADHADLREAILIDAEAGQAQFPHADLTGATLTRAELTQVDFTNAKLIGADLDESTPGQIKARKADFTRAKLHEAKMGQANLRNATFKDADLSEAEFTQAELDGADFTGALVEGASFIQADDADLTGAKGTPTGISLPNVPPLDTTDSTDSTDDTGLPLGDGVEPSAVRTGAPSVGLVMVVISAVGLALTVVIWGVSAQRRSRRNARFALMRGGAEEDVTRLGEEIDQLDYEFQVSGHGGVTGDQDWRHALDAYEAAKHALTVARREEELDFVARAVQDGRNALGRLRVRSR
ncbi:pentapeptide repeat-containing protein [Streptosporangium sp. CA-135522]|uniref:pentapeptide repeat-containing protein n=1 Tax=Streptosporangium sp. CA-135522 TaxID=3240072 RepID=UPI003D8D48E8